MDKSQDTTANDPLFLHQVDALDKRYRHRNDDEARIICNLLDDLISARARVYSLAAENAQLRSESEHWKAQALSWMGRRSTSGVTTGEGASQDGD